MSDSEKHESTKNNGRWWEFYLVRYLLGSIVGATLLIVLNNHSIGIMHGLLSTCDVKISSIESHTIPLWAGLGFAYCYLASAPILVFHATRGAGNSLQIFIKENKSILIGLALVIITLILGISTFLSSLSVGEIATYCVFLIIIELQIALIYLGQKDDGKAIYDFYKKLITARSLKSQKREIYIESYKHLREHGNAFFIVMLEFILACSIWHARTIEHLFLLLLMWFIPAAWVWLIGAKMESKIGMFS
ncbi:MAG: hypothetical protein PHC94_11705 [Methylobacter sp.]|nr:hypothetical protein [Methylobacter sp.]